MKSSSKPNQPFLSLTTNNQDTGRELIIAGAEDMVVLYNECLNNHAVRLGGHTLDGCGEFIPKSTTIHTDPPSLRWDACGCHRNFHRRNPSDVFSHHRLRYRCSHSHPLRICFSLSAPISMGPRKKTRTNSRWQGMLGLAMIKKRKRTKFTAEQKEKMRGFAERAEWKINGWDEKWSSG